MYKRYTEGYIDFLENMYQRGITSGEFIPHPVHDSAVTFMAALDGIVSYLLIDDDLDLDAVVSAFQDRLIRFFYAKKNHKQNQKG